MSENVLVRHDDPTVARFEDIPTSLVTDAFLRLGLTGWMDDVLPTAPGTRIAARARTLAWGPVRGDGRLGESMYAVMSRVGPGEVLVMGTGGTHDNLLGDNMASFAQRQGLAGIVTDSRTRDRDGIRELGERGLAVFSRGAGVRPPTEVEPREFDVPITCGGAQVRPGDIVVADNDGVVVIPADRADDVLYQIEDIAGIEQVIGTVIAAGGSLADIEEQVARKKVVRR